MTKGVESYQNRQISECLKVIRNATLALTRGLIDTGINVESIKIEHWPRYDGNQIGLQIWNSTDHILKPNSLSIDLREDDIMAIAKRRQILKRKFKNGI